MKVVSPLLNMSAIIGADTSEPTAQRPPSFQAFSLSLVRGNTLSITERMYSEENI